MPLTAKGEEIKSALVKEYGSEKKGEQVLYAGKNKGTFKGIDCETLNRITDAVGRLAERFDAMCAKRDSDESVRKAALAKVTLAHPTDPKRTEEFKKTLERALAIASKKDATKAEAKAHKTEWASALSEGRVLKYNNGQTMKSFPTSSAAQEELKKLNTSGMKAEIVRV